MVAGVRTATGLGSGVSTATGLFAGVPPVPWLVSGGAFGRGPAGLLVVARAEALRWAALLVCARAAVAPAAAGVLAVVVEVLWLPDVT